VSRVLSEIVAAKAHSLLTEDHAGADRAERIGGGYARSRPQTNARVISKEIVTADANVASQLALTKGERVVRIRRVRLADGIPLSSMRPISVGDRQENHHQTT